jgi:hypothetical protein
MHFFLNWLRRIWERATMIFPRFFLALGAAYHSELTWAEWRATELWN